MLRNRLIASSTLALILWAATSLAQVGTPQAVPFTGKLVNTGSPIWQKAEDFTSVSNLRPAVGGWETRNGATYFTSNTEPNSKPIVSLIPYQTDTEWHIVAASADPATSRVTYYQIENGSFGTALWKTSGTTSTPITYAQVKDTLAVADSGGVTLWGGVSTYPTALLVEYSNGIYSDEYNLIYSGVSQMVASGTTFHVRYSRPWTGLKTNYVLSSYDSTSSSVTPSMISGKYGYWASITATTGGSSICLPKIQVPPRELGSDWDGVSWQFPKVAGFEKTGVSAFQDYSTFLANSSQEEYMDISQWESGGTITFAWNYKPREIHVFLPEEFKNLTATSSVSAYYWNGTAYALVPSFTDGTSYNGITLSKSGVLQIPKLTDWKTRKVGENPLDLYSIVLKSNKTISNYVRIYMARAVPDYDSPSSVWMCRGVASAFNRLWLYNGRNKSHIYVSALNQPDCFTGDDARDWINPIVAGKQEDVIWLGPVGDAVLALKKTENWGIGGDGPGTWRPYQLHGSAPCVSTGSVQVIEKNGILMVIYMARNGVYGISKSASDGNPLLSGDIAAYWEPGNTLEFSSTDIQNAQSWYSKTYQEYHLLVGATELVYSLKDGKWTTFSRGSHALASGMYTTDPNRNRIELGGGKNGRVYTLESGTSDYSDAIVSDFTRPDTTLQDRIDKRSELTAVTLRYQRPDGTALAGCSAYLTPSLASTVTTKEGGFTLANNGWTFLNLYDWRDADGTKGFTHKRRYRFPGQVKLFQEIIWSQESPWSMIASGGSSGSSSSSTTSSGDVVSIGASFMDAQSGDSAYVMVPYSMTMSGVSLIVPNATLAAGASIFYAPFAIPGTGNSLVDISNGGVSVASKSGTTVIPAGSILNFVIKSVPTGASVWTVQLIGTRN